MAEYEKSKSDRSRFKIGSTVERPVVDVPAESHSSGKYLDKFASSLDLKVDDENIANQVIDDLISVKEKKADSKEGEKKASKEKEKKAEEKEKALTEEDKENFRKAGQLLALNSISKAVTGEGVSLSKEAVKKGGYWRKRKAGLGRTKREYKLLGRIGLGAARVPLWVATLPVRRPISTFGALMTAGTGLYGYGKYRRRKTEKALKRRS